MAYTQEITTDYSLHREKLPYRYEGIDILAHLAVTATGIGIVEPSPAQITYESKETVREENDPYTLSLADIAILRTMQSSNKDFHLTA